MSYDSLKYFCAAADELNVTRAARKLHMSQQTLSNHIARIEAEYGIRLFERKPHLHLTVAGECFYRHVKDVLSREEELLAEFDEINTSRPCATSATNTGSCCCSTKCSAAWAGPAISSRGSISV